LENSSLVSGAGNILIPVVGGISTTNDATSATVNTNTINAALSAGGLVQLLAAGTYYLDPLQSLVIPSKTRSIRS
jgi:butyrate kinase